MTEKTRGRPFRCLNKKFNCFSEKVHSFECLKLRQKRNFIRWYQKKLLAIPDYNQKDYEKRALTGKLNVKEFGVGSGSYTRDPNKIYGRPKKNDAFLFRNNRAI